MALFGIGNLLLKQKRKKLPRPEKASIIAVIIAIIAVLIALSLNIIVKPKDGASSNKNVFLYYFIPTILFITIMLNRTALLKMNLKLVEYIFDPIRKFVINTDKNIKVTIDKINKQEFVFFTKGDKISTLNKVMLYIAKNEHTQKIKIVSVIEVNTVLPKNFKQQIKFLDSEYPEISIKYIEVKGNFSPKLIKQLSEKWDIPVNFMFIGSPTDKFPYRIEEFGGVRLII